MSNSILDRTDITILLFHPRRSFHLPYSTSQVRLVDVEVDDGVVIGGRLYPAEASDAPVILYFHGNGEIAADYDDIAQAYHRIGAALLVMDYRGYGRSGGAPTAGNLLTDAVVVYEVLGEICKKNGLSPERIYVMGRSLGSASAIHVALHAGEGLDGLIIESGFADTFALLRRLGASVDWADDEQHGFGNLSKIRQISLPTLVIHGESDLLIPAEDGRRLYESSATKAKRLVLIPRGRHNDLMVVGEARYFQVIEEFISDT